MEITETLLAPDRQAWRSWLEANHRLKREIWLVFYKKHVRKPGVAYDEAVEEALCFGWVDGWLRRIDDEKHAIRFSPRKPGSVWAVSNKRRVERMIAAGRMTEAGLALVEAAKRSGEWDAASARESLVVPADLQAALDGDATAREASAKLAPSHRKQYISWVEEAKRQETRARRIAEVVRRVAEGGRP